MNNVYTKMSVGNAVAYVYADITGDFADREEALARNILAWCDAEEGNNGERVSPTLDL